MVRPTRNDVLAHELAIACSIAGLTHRQLAVRIQMSTARIGRALRGEISIGVDLADAIARACGYRVALRVIPGDGVSLRDSGQLALTEVIRRQAHPTWRIALEAPIGLAPDRRAADMLLVQSAAAVLLEIERWLIDFQAQLRAAQLKRTTYAERTDRIVRLVIAVPDTPTARRLLAPHRELIAAAFPVSSRTAWACIRSGEPFSGDALMWVRS